MTENDLSFDGVIPGEFAAAKPNRRASHPARPDSLPPHPAARGVSGPPPAQPTPRGPVLPASGREEYRGLGDVYVKQPIAAVVEVLGRVYVDGKWQIKPAFTKGEKGQFAFAIMTPRTTTTIMRGTYEAPAREPHPQFTAFNSAHPDKACSLRGILIHWKETDAWRFNLGSYAPPAKGLGPEKGWFCRGDGKQATRWDASRKQFVQITCPNRLCEFQQPQFGFKRDQALCKPNISLIAQFCWADGSPLPNAIFEWNSKSWHGYASCEGMFRLIRETSQKLGIAEPTVFGLPFTMTVRETKTQGKSYPEVAFSIVGSPMEWLQKIYQTLEQSKQMSLNAPPPLAVLPAPGMTADDQDRATEAALNPNYRPANER